MSEERLEKAKKILNHIKGYGIYDGNDDIEIFEWLIEQAERVADYEKRYEKHLDIDIRNNHKIQCLEYQIKRYREALEFYADEDNYREHDLKGIVPPRPIAYKPILHDYGSIARQALESEK